MVLYNGGGSTPTAMQAYWLGPPGGGVGLLGIGASGVVRKANRYANYTLDIRSVSNPNNAWWTSYSGDAGSADTSQAYGGGGGGLNFASGSSACPNSICPYTWAGMGGACRIIWGTGCSFPSSAGSDCYVRSPLMHDCASVTT